MGQMKRVVLAGIAVVVVSAVTAFITAVSLRPAARGLAATKDVAVTVFPTTILGAEQPEKMLWPMDRASVISVRLGAAGPPKPGARWSLVVRTTSHSVDEGWCYRLVKRGAPQRRVLGFSLEDPAPETAIVSMQVMDAGAGPALGGRDRERLLFRLQAGSSTVGAAMPMEGVYEGYASAGVYGPSELKDGEIHLMNVWARSGEVVNVYDVVLLREDFSDEPATAALGGGG